MSGNWALYQDTLIPRQDAKIDIEDRGYQFGDGVYEVIRVYNGKLFLAEAHAKRMERSLKELRIPFPDCTKRVLKGAQMLVEAEGIVDGIVYLQISRGIAPRVHQFPSSATIPIFTGSASSLPRPFSYMDQGIEVLLLPDIRWLRNDIKSLNLLGAVLSKQQAKERGCYEAILERAGILTEGSSSNLFIVSRGELLTHPANNLILNGITRLEIFRLAAEAKLACKEVTYTVDELFAADEAFICGTTTEIMPIRTVTTIDAENRAYHYTIGTGAPGPLTKTLQKAFDRLVKDVTADDGNKS
ncbi:D-amino-acid transaminase [Gracilinema caldarium]|uniref:D-alanine aminotransferase n=1 Tax=Gracilinema caldarium (strain ATCC 51460 / DSM 7334 / H1) TaxID=744872 RepID=F8F1M1_GRAC1|nr:D-amino-acid transaminase [Gracilinema caldarium]AEJ19355.1 D-amino acid aminotransferase [Gracilinema caldarium DSM 7334]